MKLQLRLLTWVLIVGLGSGAVGVYVLTLVERHLLTREFAKMTEITAHTIHYALEGMMIADRRDLVAHTLARVRQAPWIEDVAVYRPDGRRWLSNGRVGNEPGEDRVGAIARVARTGRHELLTDESYGQTVQVFVPIENHAQCHGCHPPGQAINGVLEVGLNRAAMDPVVIAHNRVLVGAGVLLLGLIGGTLLVVTRRTVLGPLEVMVTSMERVASGDYSARLVPNRTDELGRIARTFNSMIERVATRTGDLATEREVLQHRVDALFITSVQALAAALEARDAYTKGHSEFVSAYAVAIADELGFEPFDQDDLRLAGLLHDIGKLGIGDDILKADRQIDVRQELTVVAHPTLGAAILEKAESLQRLAPLVRHHHERYDGSGYPAGLTGDAIPLGARILAVADAFEAMTSDRSYRPALSLKTARARLIAGKGSQFDPRVVDAFLRVLDQEQINDLVVRRQDLRSQLGV